MKLSAEPRYAADNSITHSIWRSWARRDLESALVAAQSLQPHQRKASAAQAMYMAMGAFDLSSMQRIEAMLGIPPSQWIKWKFTEAIAQTSPSDAVNYLNNMQPRQYQGYVAGQLGSYLGKTQAQSALSYVELVTSISSRNRFKNAVLNSLAQENPRQYVEQYLQEQHMSSPANQSVDQQTLRTAFAAIARQNIDEAIDLWNQVSTPQVKFSFAQTILLVMGQRDPAKAIEWASQAELQGVASLLDRSINGLSTTNPSATLSALYALPDGSRREKLIAKVIGRLADVDLNLALSEVRQLPEGEARKLANGMIIERWIDSDPEAAVAFAMENSDSLDNRGMNKISRHFSKIPLDSALRLIEAVDSNNSSHWVDMLGYSMIEGKSTQEVEQLLAQSRHFESFPDLQNAVISQMASLRPDDAIQMVESLPPGQAKDRATSNLVRAVASREPQRAALILEGIESQSIRKSAISELILQWSNSDREGASRWIKQLPQDSARDSAIAMLLMNGVNTGSQDVQLINSIGNDYVKQQIVSSNVLRLANQDVENARDFLRSIDLAESEIKRLEQLIDDCSNQNMGQAHRAITCQSGIF